MSPIPEAPTQPQPHRPGEGGWTPPAWVPPIVGACIGGGLNGLGIAFAAFDPSQPLYAQKLIGAFVAGCGTAVIGYLGIKSAGVRKP